jgi:hypothetical protein
MEEKIREIIRQIGDIGEKASRLLAERDIPEIELDIILADLRVLYENVRVLRSDKGGPESRPKAGTSPAEASGAAAVTQAGHTEMAAEPESKAAATDPGNGGGSAGSPSKPSEKSILADKYKSGQTFINESLAGKRGNQDISSKIHPQYWFRPRDKRPVQADQ